VLYVQIPCECGMAGEYHTKKSKNKDFEIIHDCNSLPWHGYTKLFLHIIAKTRRKMAIEKLFFVRSPCMVQGPLDATPGTTHRKQLILWYHESNILYLVVIQKNMSNDFDPGSCREKT